MLRMVSVRIAAAGVQSVVGLYQQRDPRSHIPAAFAKVCEQMRWDPLPTWRKLSDQTLPWFLHDNGSYIYKNTGDGQWWIDEPSGGGVYVARSEDVLPPASGWEALSQGGSAQAPMPKVEVVR